MLSWATSMELWFLHQIYHTEKEEFEGSTESYAQWKKVNFSIMCLAMAICRTLLGTVRTF